MYIDIPEKFKQAMIDAGLKPDCDPIADGKIHRFHDLNDKKGTKNGWYVLYTDGVPAGRFSSWKSGIDIKWCAKAETELSSLERESFVRRIKDAARQREKALEENRLKCRVKVNEIWDNSPSANETHPYLQKKGIDPHGARIFDNRLIIPLMNLEGTLHGLQYIGPNGHKLFEKGTSVKGNFFSIGDLVSPSILVVCEGFATGASIHAATSYTVICSMNCGNLVPVAKVMRQHFPQATIIIAADNDRWTDGNPGLSKATEASNAIQAKLSVPTFLDDETHPVDFNDLHSLEGLETVKQQIQITLSAPLQPPSTDQLDPKNEKQTNKPSASDLLLKLTSQYECFIDEHRNPFAFVSGECIPIKDTKIRNLLSFLYFQETGKAAPSEAIGQVVNTLAAKALYEGDQISLNIRVAWSGKSIMYDMGDSRSIRVTEDGWSIVESPIMFRRYGHQQKQVDPVAVGDPYQVFNFLNIETKHELIFIVTLVSCFIPGIPHPILHPHGDEGSGKSTMFRILKKLIDPSSLELCIKPKDENEIIRTISRHHLSLFDNMSQLTMCESDIFCMACTGGGISKRQLFSDDEDVIFTIKGCVGINGINLMITKPDLLDRTILLHLSKIQEELILEEREMWRRFDEAKPQILGGILDVIVNAMRIFPDVVIDRLPRMADYARWGYAIAEAIGIGNGQKFLDALRENNSRQINEIVAENTLCRTVIQFMDDKQLYSGTIGELYRILRGMTQDGRNDTTFPKAPKTLRSHLDRVRVTLSKFGIDVTYGQHTTQGMTITLFNRNYAPSDEIRAEERSAQHEAPEANNASYRHE